jgi:hypothetical protein
MIVMTILPQQSLLATHLARFVGRRTQVNIA